MLARHVGPRLEEAIEMLGGVYSAQQIHDQGARSWRTGSFMHVQTEVGIMFSEWVEVVFQTHRFATLSSEHRKCHGSVLMGQILAEKETDNGFKGEEFCMMIGQSYFWCEQYYRSGHHP